MNSGLYEYHHGRYYSHFCGRQATECEQGLCRRFLEAWRRDGQSVRRWKFDAKLMQAVRQDTSEPEVVKPEALKLEMTCVANQHQVAKINVEDTQCCNLTSVLALENQLKRNTEGFDCPCEDENLQVQPAVKNSLQKQPVAEGQELGSKPEQKPKQQKRKSREKRKEQKKGRKQVTTGERMDGGNTKKRRKTVVSARKVGKKSIRCKTHHKNRYHLRRPRNKRENQRN